MKGRVAVLKEYFKPFELVELEVPEPQPGAAVVKISMAGLCGSDLHTWRGDHGSNRKIPAEGMLLGHEGVGYVQSLGTGLTSDFLGNPLKEGDRIVFSALAPCDHCLQCLSGRYNLCLNRTLINSRARSGQFPFFVNTYADFVYLFPGHPVFKVSDSIADEEIVALNCAMGTVLEGLQTADMRQGQSVVVQGVGGLGLYAVALAKDAGATTIIAVDGQDARLNLAKELGADATIDIKALPTAEERVEFVQRATGGRGADIVLELAGFGDLVQEGINMLGPGGRFVEIGNLIRGRMANIEPASLLRGKRIIGSAMYRPSIIPTILDFIERNQGHLPLRKIISHRFPLEKINEAFTESEWVDKSTPVIRSAIVP